MHCSLREQAGDEIDERLHLGGGLPMLRVHDGDRPIRFGIPVLQHRLQQSRRDLRFDGEVE